MKKVLLTGATGFIGRHTIPFLLSDGYEVHAIVRKSHALPEGVYSYEADLFDDNKITQLLSSIKPTHLLHYAWYTVPGKYWSSETNLDCVRSSIKLFQEFAASGGKRIVVSGTCAEYKWEENPCDEFLTPMESASLYGACKASLYKLLEAYARQKNLSFAWGRIFFLYGPYESKERLIPSVIQKLLNNEMAPCSHGHQVRDFMYVEDVASAFVALLSSELQGAINIASGQNYTLRQIIDAISSKLEGQDKIQYGAIPAPYDPPRICAKINRLQNELIWKSKYSLDSGLNQTIDWWKKQQDTLESSTLKKKFK